jgi:glucokinase
VTGWAVALDVGGTTIKGAIVGPDGTMYGRLRRPTPCDRGPDAVMDSVGATVDLLLADARQRGLEVAAAGVVVPGIVDDERGVASQLASGTTSGPARWPRRPSVPPVTCATCCSCL